MYTVYRYGKLQTCSTLYGYPRPATTWMADTHCLRSLIAFSRNAGNNLGADLCIKTLWSKRSAWQRLTRSGCRLSSMLNSKRMVMFPRLDAVSKFAPMTPGKSSLAKSYMAAIALLLVKRVQPGQDWPKQPSKSCWFHLFINISSCLCIYLSNRSPQFCSILSTAAFYRSLPNLLGGALEDDLLTESFTMPGCEA